MTSYIIGNLLGRLLASYIIVWLAMFTASNFDWRAGFRKAHRWYGIVSVVIVFLLGVAGAASKVVS
jgi:hypothetical protein